MARGKDKFNHWMPLGSCKTVGHPGTPHVNAETCVAWQLRQPETPAPFNIKIAGGAFPGCVPTLMADIENDKLRAEITSLQRERDELKARLQQEKEECEQETKRNELWAAEHNKLETERKTLQRELWLIDEAFSRRPALASAKTMFEKAYLACEEAGKVAGLEREIAQLKLTNAALEAANGQAIQLISQLRKNA